MRAERSGASAATPEHIVVLVHGTFARGADWTHDDSRLATALTDELAGDVLLVPFEWSGSNTHAARLKAGLGLAQHICSLKHTHPSASIHVVAHSHGGNVVAYATREDDVRDSLRSVVCLGTPFIVARPRKLGPTLRLLKFLEIALKVLVALLIALAVGMVTTLAVYIPGVTTLLGGATLLLVIGALSYRAFRLLVRLDGYVSNTVVPGLQSKQNEVVASLEARFDSVPVLNLQTRRDEAAGFLRLVDVVARVPFQLWSPNAVLWATVGITAFYVAGMAFVTVGSEDWRSAWNEALLGLVFGYLVYVVLVVAILALLTLAAQTLCTVWPKIFRGHALGFGEDGFAKNWLVAISASRRPDSAAGSHDELLSVTGKGLRHSLLYRDEHAIELVAAWVARERALENGG